MLQPPLFPRDLTSIFTIALSPLDKNVIWTGSDDGLIHLTTDGGKNWSDVTPPAIQPWTRINIIEASPHDVQTAYVAANRYQVDDFKPYIYRTHDMGRTWTLVSTGIAAEAFARSVRQDRVRKDLLYAATETGVYVSFDDGDHWQSLQLNLPIVPITDITVKDGDLVVSTQGRSFWILDDITPLQQLTQGVAASKVHLYQPRPAYRYGSRSGFESERRSIVENPPSGVVVYYSLAEAPAGPVSLEFQDAAGALIDKFSSDDKQKGRAPVKTEAGLNRFVWNMRYPDAHGVDGGTYFLGGTLNGPRAVPGRYIVKLSAGGQSVTQEFEIKKDPRLATTATDYEKQFQLSLAIRDKVSALDDAVNSINRTLHELDTASQSPKADDAIRGYAAKLKEKLGDVLHHLIEPRFTGFDDQTLVFPLKLNNRLASLQGYLHGDQPPTEQDFAVFEELSAELARELSALNEIFATDIPAFNSHLKTRGLPPLVIR